MYKSEIDTSGRADAQQLKEAIDKEDVSGIAVCLPEPREYEFDTQTLTCFKALSDQRSRWVEWTWDTNKRKFDVTELHL